MNLHGKEFGTTRHTKQLKLNRFPSKPPKKLQKRKKEIRITQIFSVTKYDEMALFVEFKLIPSKTAFSKLKSTLWFDDQKITSASVRIPQRFGVSNEFHLKSALDMRGINTGTHTIKVELQDLFSPCFGTKEETIKYVPKDRTAEHKKIPTVKMIEGERIAVLSESEKNIYQEIQETLKKDLNSSRDKW